MLCLGTFFYLITLRHWVKVYTSTSSRKSPLICRYSFFFPFPPFKTDSATFPSFPPGSGLFRKAGMSKVAEEEPPEGHLILLPCHICFRTFKVESLERHKSICQVVATKKRKVFDSFKQRVQDLPDIPAPAADTRRSGGSLKIPSWKDKHRQLIKTVRAARVADHTRCPYCERNFGNKAYDRHTEWCREQQSRIPKSPTNLEAKERWEARTKVRTPFSIQFNRIFLTGKFFWKV